MHVYVGTFLAAFSMLALEVTLTRLLSVITWYHLAFFAVSTAMLGMTAGATTVYLRPALFERDRLEDSLCKACLAYGLVVPLALVILCLTPLRIPSTSMDFIALLQATLACALPFYFAGIAISAVLTKSSLPIGKLYAADLIGASLGCLLVLGGLEVLDAPTLILLTGPVAALAGVAYAWRSTSPRLRKNAARILVLLLVPVLVNLVGEPVIRPLMVKGQFEDPRKQLLVKWNSYSRVLVEHRQTTRPQYWGPSPRAPMNQRLPRHMMNIDGGAGTMVRRFSSPQDIEHLRFDVTNVAYFLRPSGGACVIGVGGGRDIQSAILFGHERVVGVDVNPTFIKLLTGRLRQFAGIADHEGVTLVVDEARSYLSRHRDSFSVIQMSLIDTWAATGAGAFSLSENGLYTVEAWRIILDDLADDGIFTVSRWYDPNSPGETGRIVSLAVATLLDAGVEDPSGHIAMVTCDRISTLLLSKTPFSPKDLATLQRTCARLEYALEVTPSAAPGDEMLNAMLGARDLAELERAVATAQLNYVPPTDDNPYFFNMLRLSQVGRRVWATRGVLRGNLVATTMLVLLIVCLMLVAAVTIVFPLLAKSRLTPGESVSLHWWSAAYFSLIGAGFMFVEIALIQRLSVVLSHPIYALGILLMTIIASAGVGSLLSERLPLTRKPWLYVFPVVIAVLVVVTRYALPAVGARVVATSMLVKIVVSVLIIAPLGLLLGLCFPTGMRLVQAARGGETPWYWALNGIFGVLCSALAVFISIYLGISTSFFIGAACYALLLFCIPRMVDTTAG